MLPSVDQAPQRPARAFTLLAVAVASLALVFGSVTPAFAANTDSVSGVVTRGSVPAENVSINLFRATAPFGFVGSATSDSNGEYSFTGLAHGTYSMSIFGGGEFPTVIGKQFVLSVAKPNLDFPLVIAPWPTGTATLTGTVTDAGTTLPIEGLTVQFNGQDQARSAEFTTGADGTFSFDRLPGGVFTLSIFSGDYQSEWRNVAVGDGGDYVQDFALGLRDASFSGTVIDDSTGQVIPGVDPMIFPPSGPSVAVSKVGDSFFRFGYALDLAGVFSSPTVAAGQYELTFGGAGSPWTKTSTTITVDSGEAEVVELHTTPREASAITGKVTAFGSTAGLAGICVDVYDDATGDVVAGAYATSSTGIYTTSDIDPGVYKLLFWDCAGSTGGPSQNRNPGYAMTFLGGGNWIDGVVPAGKVEVEAGETATAPTMGLKIGASISGHINVAVPGGTTEFVGGRGMDATIYQFAGGQWVPMPDPGAFVGDGNVGDYTATGLAPGTYRVGFSDQGPANYRAYTAQYWPAASNVGAGTSITVTAGQKKTGVNASVRIPRPGDSPEAVGTGDLTPFEEDVIDASDSAAPGSSLSIDVGADHAGEWMSVWGHSTPTAMGSWVQVDKAGKVTVTVPTSLAPGDHDLVVQNASGGVLGWSDLALAGGPYPADAPGAVAVGFDPATKTLGANLADWPVGTTFAYQWFRSPTLAGAGTAITTGKTSVYMLAAADTNQFLKVRVIATVPGYAPVTRFSTAAPYTIIAGGVPTISGEIATGQQLTAVPPTYTSYQGTLTPGFSYQWLRNGANIIGAQAETYTLGAGDVGKAISVRILATATGLFPSTTTSAATQPVGASLTGWNDQPNVTVSQVGAVLTAAADGITQAGATRTYQWFRSGVAVAGATKVTYSLTAADTGKAVHVVVTVKKAAFTTIVKRSLPLNYSIVPSGPNTVSGTAQVGKTLSIDPVTYTTKDGAITPGLTYAWFRNGAAIAGASGSSYTLVAADLAAKITARVTATATGYVTQVGALTVATPAVVKGIFTGSLVAPSVVASSTGVLSTTLEAGTVDAVPAPAYTLSYQWFRVGTVAPIATTATYKLLATDAGKGISVKVTVNKGGYTSAPLPQTAPVDYAIVAVGGSMSVTATTVGDTIMSTLPTFSAKGLPLPSPTIAYAWLRNGVPITGATGESYVVQSADFGAKISLRITATSPGLIAKVVTTPATSAVGKGVLKVWNIPPVVTVAQGGLLTAALGDGTTSMPAPTLTYKWMRGIPLVSETAIPGATGRTYQLTTADQGKQVWVVISISKANTTTDGVNPPLVSQGVNYTLVPAATVFSEALFGTYRVDNSMYVSTTTYTLNGNPVVPAMSYQWLRNGVAIPGATANTYAIVPADVGTKLTVRVTAVASSAPLVVTTVDPTVVQKGVFDGSFAPPTVTLDVPTMTLSAALTPGSITAPSPTLTYQWYRGSTAVTGATKSTYKLSAADFGQLIKVLIKVSRPGYAPPSPTAPPLMSTPTGYSVAPTGLPVISGEIANGQVVQLASRTYNTAVTEACQWLRNGTAISGATVCSGYTLKTADVGTAISVRVTASAPGYLTSVSTSAATQKVGAAVMAGDRLSNVTLSYDSSLRKVTVNSTGITELGVTFAYQWFRDTTAIATAKAASYTLVPADNGKNVWVQVTITKATFTPVVKSSLKASFNVLTATGDLTLDTSAPVVGGTVSLVLPGIRIGGADWVPQGPEAGYYWYADDVEIPGERGAQLTVTPDLEGKHLRVEALITTTGVSETLVLPSVATSPVVVP